MNEKYIVSINREGQNLLADYMPPLHFFRQSATDHVFNTSGIHMHRVVLLKPSDFKEDQEHSEWLAKLYDGMIERGETDVAVEITHLGWDTEVMAFKCKALDEDCKMLVSTYGYGPDERSMNRIDHWIELKPIYVFGTLKKVKR